MHWYWTHVASRGGIDVDAFEWQWREQEYVCIDGEKKVYVVDVER